MTSTDQHRANCPDCVKLYSVTLWGSNPDETDNDYWTDEDYATREEAIAAYQSLYKYRFLRSC